MSRYVPWLLLSLVLFACGGDDEPAAAAPAKAEPEPVSPSLLAKGTGLPVNEVNESLDHLEWHRWMAAESRGYSFVARIVRATIARDMLTEGQRERLRRLSTEQ